MSTLREGHLMTPIFDQPIERFRTKADLVYDDICAAILDGRLAPGQRLNVDEIARELGVSKIPVREAVSRLESRGFVVQTPHAGARVAPVSLRELKGIFLVRIELEGLATRLAAETITEPDMARLRAIQAETEDQYAAGEMEWMSHHNRCFHKVIAHATGYATLADLIETTLLTVMRYRAVLRVEPAVWRESLDEHLDIIAALDRHDPVAAERAAQAHVNRRLERDIQWQIDQLDHDEPGLAPAGAVAREAG